MTKLFNKKRKQLVSEKPSVSRTRNYLKYAIGEIVLVVIGILIALSINNWNEGRKNQILVKNYTKNLIEDLKKDSIIISDLILKIKIESISLNNFEKRVSKSTAALDTILKIARYEYDWYILVYMEYNRNTYKVLTSTGDIVLFNNEIINDLNVLNSFQELALSTTAGTFENYRNNVHLYAQKYPVPFQSNLISNNTNVATLIWEQISLTQHATEFNALVLAKGDSYRLSLSNLPKVLTSTTILLAKLRKI